MVRQQYFLLLQALLLERVAGEALGVSEEQLRRSDTLFELGSVARTDVLQARVNRATAVQELIRARNSVAQERARLAVLLGMSAADSLEIRTDVPDPPETVLEEESLMQQAVEERPEVRRAEAELAASRMRSRSAFWSQFPSLSGALFYNRQVDARPGRGDAFSDLIALDDLQQNASWGFSIGLDWSIFDGLGTIGEVKSSRAGVSSAREARRQEELDAGLAVREAEVAIRNAREGIQAAQESVELAEENLRLQQALYENGGGTILELNNAQVERTRAHNSLIEARIGLHVAYAQLDRALGR
jgi:outer membrane protein TolC